MTPLQERLAKCMAAIASAAARNDQTCLAALQDYGNMLLEAIPAETLPAEPSPIS